MPAPVVNSRLAFGLFEIDAHTGELWKTGFRVRLQSQPVKVLLILLERPGELVTREELQSRIWGRDTNVDFDHSLGTAINKIREALGDSADNPRFIETLARRGYRFIAPVRPVEVAPGAGEAAAGLDSVAPDRTVQPPPHDVTWPAAAAGIVEPSLSEPQRQANSLPGLAASRNASVAIPGALVAAAGSAAVSPKRMGWGIVAAACIALLAVLLAYLVGRNRAEPAPVQILQVTHNGNFAASVVTMEKLAATATDGVHLYATTFQNGHAELASIALPDGTVSTVDVPEEVASPALGAISPDGSKLVLRDHLSPESEQPLWIVPTMGGSALRVGNVLAHDATWMPDGQKILYANGNYLILSALNGGNPESYATLPGRAFWLRWSPSGSLLRFTIIDPLTHTLELWQLSARDRKPVRLLADFDSTPSECCGVWTPDGRWFVFQSSRGGNTDLWRLEGNATSGPRRVTDGPLQFQAPAASRTGDRIYFLGADARSELDRLTSNGDLTPEHGFLADAVRLEYARNGRLVAWTDTAGRLWCAHIDGSERLQLTPDGLDIFMARWSPDSSHLAIMARVPGKAWNIYMVAADGSDLHPLMHEARNAADPSWSPDGQSLVFGRTNDTMGEENARSLELLDLRTGAIRPLPGSEGLFSPRWSPDGRYIVALSLDQSRAELFDVEAQAWRKLAVPSAAEPVWSADSRELFLQASLSPAQPIERISIPEGRAEVISQLGNATETNAVDYVLSGLAADGTPLVRTRIYTGDLFSIELPR